MKKTKPTSPRVQHNREVATASILDAARAIMREEGVAALSMQGLARRMEIRAPSLYNYFTSKMDVYDAIFRLGMSMYDEHLQAALKTSKNAHDQIRIVIESYMSFALANPELYQLCFERPVPGFIPSRSSMDLSLSILNRAYQHVESFKKEFSTDLNSTQIADLVIAVSHGLTALHLANEPKLPIGKGRFGSLIPAAMTMLDAILFKGK